MGGYRNGKSGYMQGETMDSLKERVLKLFVYQKMFVAIAKILYGIWMRTVYSGWHYQIVGLELKTKSAKRRKEEQASHHSSFFVFMAGTKRTRHYLGEKG